VRGDGLLHNVECVLYNVLYNVYRVMLNATKILDTVDYRTLFRGYETKYRLVVNIRFILYLYTGQLSFTSDAVERFTIGHVNV
jgi:hypothetical protein